MTIRATQLVYAAAGRPSPRKSELPVEVEAPCYWCGGPLHGVACLQATVCGDTFTDHDCASAPESRWICRACTWSMTGRPPDTLRLWSVLWIESGLDSMPSHALATVRGPGLHLQNKADLSAFDRVLARPPAGRWAASVADSGKLHVFPHAVVNTGAGPWRIRFERHDVHGDPGVYRRLAGAVVEALATGFYKSELLGQISSSRLVKIGIEPWRRYERAVGRHRGGVLLELVVFLAKNPHKKEKEAV